MAATKTMRHDSRDHPGYGHDNRHADSYTDFKLR
jgi:hypothetical protein